MTIKNTKNILIAPLDWGLGHTTRCIPIIKHLLAEGHRVLFAGNQTQRTYISSTLPQIDTIHLDGYNVRYSKSRLSFMPAIAKQIPAILNAIKKEHIWLQKTAQEYHIDGIISDNRYGLYHDSIPNTFMTHQLQVLTGMGSIANDIMRRLHKRFINKYDECWVVDSPLKPGISGILSHSSSTPAKTKYIGLLSQVEPNVEQKEKHTLVLLSGPEPQRSILSGIIWQQAINQTSPLVFVEGSNDAKEPDNIPSHISYHKRMEGEKLNDPIARAELVICRSGYSSVMDLIKLNKAAVLIPTPGQTEQEYLAKLLQEQNLFSCISQKQFSLSKALQMSKGQNDKTVYLSQFSLHKEIINSWLQEL